MKSFVLDVHLAKLARHLRMVGFDSLWRDDFEDSQLLEISAQEGRVLLTRDRELVARAVTAGAAEQTFWVPATDPGEQLAQVLYRFSLIETVTAGKGFLSRCLDCNSPILPVKASQIEERLPAHVRSTQVEFYLCPRCERVFWKGSHFLRMQRWVAETVARFKIESERA